MVTNCSFFLLLLSELFRISVFLLSLCLHRLWTTAASRHRRNILCLWCVIYYMLYDILLFKKIDLQNASRNFTVFLLCSVHLQMKTGYFTAARNATRLQRKRKGILGGEFWKSTVCNMLFLNLQHCGKEDRCIRCILFWNFIRGPFSLNILNS